jgi:O-antigen/teichoic acid export membrane protein
MQKTRERARRLGASPTGKRLLTTTFWSAVSESLSRGLLLVSLVFVARALGREAYGQFGIIRSTINMFATLGGMGLGFTANRYVAEFRDRDKPYSGHIIGSSYVLGAVSGLLVGLGVFAGSGWLATGVLRAPQLQSGLQIAGFLLFLGAINGAQIGILQGLEAYRRLALGNLAQGVTAITCLIVGAHFFGLLGALVGFLAYTCAGVAILHLLITNELRRQRISVTYTNFAATLPIFWRFSFPVMLAGTAIAPLKWLAETMLVRNVGFAELGIFHASMTIATMLIAIVSTLNAPLLSLTANADGASGTRKMQYLSLYGSWYVLLGIAVPFACFPRLTSVLFGGKYATTQFYTVNLLLLLYCALLMYNQGVIRLVALKGSMWFAFHTNLVEGTALIVGFFLLADHGVVGLGIAYVLSYVVKLAVSIPYLTRQKIIPASLLYDRYFVATLVGFAVFVALQVRGIQ